VPKAKQSLNDLLYEVKRIEEHRVTLSESKVRKIYKQLMKELTAFVGEEYVKYADADGVLTFSTLRDRARQARFIEEVAAKVDSITPELHGEIMGLCEKTYKSCYEGMGKAVRSASNTEELAKVVKGGLVTPDVVKQSFDNSISKLTLPNALEKHRQEVIYTVKQELSIGLINGDRYEKMARRLTDKLDISYGKATRIVRTESHRNIESGFFDCAERLADKMEGSGLVSVCTWRTMKDDRVRPNVRRKTKKGWKTYKSKNGADHVAMEGKTVRVGDFFVFPDGVKTKAPSKSGEARHDCNCRCFLEYDVMTEEEFAKVNANKTEKTKTVSDNTDTGEKEDLTERRRQRLAQRDKKGEKQAETVITPEYIQEKHGVAVDISAAGKNGAEAQRSLEHLDRLLTEYDSTMVSYSVVPSVFGSEGGSAYMLNGKTAVQVQGKALRVVRAADDLGLGENQPLGVTYHEFAHTLSQSREKMTPEFWKEIRQVHREYKKAIYDEGKTELKISLYADKDVDEFFAEAFTQAKLSEDASPYAKKVLEITDKYFKKPVAKSAESGIIKSDIIIPRSVGAAGRNYPVQLPNGNHAKLVEGTKITKVKAFAGKGTNTPIRDAVFLENDYGIPAEEWQKVRGNAYVIVDGQKRLAEVHWYEAKGQRVKMKVKRYIKNES